MDMYRVFETESKPMVWLHCRLHGERLSVKLIQVLQDDWNGYELIVTFWSTIDWHPACFEVCPDHFLSVAVFFLWYCVPSSQNCNTFFGIRRFVAF